MRIAVVIVRVLMGLLFLAAAILFFFKLGPQPELKGSAKLFMEGMQAATYFLPFMMGTQLVCGLAFLIGRFVPLATVVIFPVTLNILLYHTFVLPEGLPVAIVLLLANLFLAYAYRKHYGPLLAAKGTI